MSLTPFQRRLGERLATRQAVEAGPTSGSAPPLWCAVAVLVTPDPDAILLIRRAERAGDPWSGHMGLPGGRLDAGDGDLLGTAMRETVEEVGCALRREELLGVLDDVQPGPLSPRPVIVRPFVFALASRPATTLSAEVAETFWVPIAGLRDPAIYRDTVQPIRGTERSFPAYHVGPHVVWGLTERILTPLLRLV